jgi:virulence-associated protein VapD
LEVRSKKIQELNKYKEEPTEKKYKDIQTLLGMMTTHGRLPKSLLVKEEEAKKNKN